MDITEPDEIYDVVDLCEYMLKYAKYIFVREQDENGKWGSFSLAELPGEKALKHALGFIMDGRIPVRIKTDEELIREDIE